MFKTAKGTFTKLTRIIIDEQYIRNDNGICSH